MKKCLSPPVNKLDMASQKIPYTFPIVGNFVLTNYGHLLLYICYHVSKSTIYSRCMTVCS